MSNSKVMLPHTYGLVVCGGNSSRMNRDKSLLCYYNKPQRYHVYEMLQPLCEKVFISCNYEQSGTIEAGYNFLPDKPVYQNSGPMAALLTAFDHFPGKHILFIGCDYPFLTAADLQDFSIHCSNGQPVAFYNKPEDLYEPLLAWYPHQSSVELKKMYDTEQFSLQHFLKDSAAIKYDPQNMFSIQSIDSPEGFVKALNLINTK